ncbi:MAG: TnpV protein [Clostridiales bacterium]|nr:TnpV protein [Clostridiales bacterium]
MEKSVLTYHREGDYLLPDLVLPESPRIGIWGTRRKQYLKQYHDGIYTGLLLSGKLNAHLEEIDRSANEMFDLLMKQCVEREGVTEELKAKDEMTWVQKMNEIRERVEEAIRTELIYR